MQWRPPAVCQSLAWERTVASEAPVIFDLFLRFAILPQEMVVFESGIRASNA
jgi:hypothetical protein